MSTAESEAPVIGMDVATATAGLTSLTSALVVCAAALVALAAVHLAMQRDRQKFPPGPSLPDLMKFVLLEDGSEFIQFRKKWRNIFGHIYTLFVGRKRIVTLASYDIIHDAFVRHAHACSSRPDGMGAVISGGDSGLLMSPHYKEQRKFALAVLREQGMGKIDMEYKIHEEIRPFIKEIEAGIRQPLDMEWLTRRAISNIICNLVLGSRFEYDDFTFISLLKRFENHLKYFKKMFYLQKFPFLSWLPGDIFGFNRYIKEAQENMKYFQDALRKHSETLNPDCPRDFIDAFLVEIKAQESGTSATKSFDEANCISTVIQLFIAGTDTTSSALNWAWLLMMLNQNIQQKVQSEIDSCIGARAPALSDKAQMPYTEAVLTEVMRFSSISPASLPHQVDKPMEIGGHLIPAGTYIIASLVDVYLDERAFPDANAFKPERFITASGSFEKPKNFIPFGIGRRACIGESLAWAEMFLFFVSVLQQFHLAAPANCNYDNKGVLKFVLQPKQYKIIFHKRTPF